MAILSPLDEVGWLSSQPERFQEWAARVGKWKVYNKAEALYQADRRPDALYGLAQGCLEISVPVKDGELVSIYFAEPGFWIGESAILSQAKRAISLSAAAESRLFRISAEDILALLEREPAFWTCFYALSHENTSLAIREYANALILSPKAHLCEILIRLSKSAPSVAITQDQVAKLLGVTRSTVQRLLSDLVEKEAISLSYASIHVIDRKKLFILSRSHKEKNDLI
ncbi:MAG: Crp/Fnr family transcriptional regulator [Beijerinckiaceae bacterium]|nr:Crp/Fnr family transcriptional regulator [Beijerinckiaceae bacterium]